MSQNKKRMLYLLAAFIFLGIEILIALYVHDDFVRPYVGDILVVVVIYTFLKVISPQKNKLLPIYIFVFAVLIEGLQYFEIVKLLGAENNRFLSVLIGSTFDVKDILCYGIGCLLVAIHERKQGV